MEKKNFPEWDDYIKQMLSHVKFRFDHSTIREEYSEHMEDIFEMLTDAGMDEKQAQREVLKQMGDADANGEGLNMAHHPLIGWMWRISRILMIGVLVLVIGIRGFALWETISDNFGGYLRVHWRFHIMTEYEINEFVTVDDVTFYFDNVVRVQSPDSPEYQDVLINYIVMPHIFSKTPVMQDNFWEQYVTDEYGTELGDNVNTVSAWYKVWDEENGRVSYQLQGTKYGFNTAEISRFPPDSDRVIIDYKKNDKAFHMEIPVTPVSDLRKEVAEWTG